jgi:hypothetical protein
MLEDLEDRVFLVDDGDDLHLRAAARAEERVDLVDSSSVPAVKDWAEKKLKKKGAANTPPVDAAIQCLGGLKYKKSIDGLIALLKDAEAAAPKPAKGAAPVAADTRIVASLTRLSTQSFKTSTEWTNWWKKNEAGLNDDLTAKKK